MTNLSVNVNKIALIRNSRKGNTPCIENFSRTCIAGGAKGITVHPRPDLRHIRPDDLEILSNLTKEESVEFNIEGNPFEDQSEDYPGFMRLIEDFKPTQCTLVPDSSTQLTSDHGWNILSEMSRLEPIINQLKDWKIRVCLFLDHDIAQIEVAKNLNIDRVEIYTGPYAEAFRNNDLKTIENYQEALIFSNEIGMDLNAGHDLSLLNIEKFINLGRIEEVSIGHALVSESLIFGAEETMNKYIKILGN
ncbi:pyridoxine 5'-phosphate synthase [SAR86 cluster bacterium]|jgi:pyridoxine 5-phosphate synthase|nr:pyridoxine 5'-phosphate synthase [SAR86 cluster bacterium]